MKDYYDYYKTERGYHPRSVNSGLGWNKTSSLAFVNAPILAYADETAVPCYSFMAKKPTPVILARMPSGS